MALIDRRPGNANPFTPDFGQRPPVMAGRDGVTDSILDSWATGPRDPGFTTLLLGQRGAGKTALMGVLAEEAKRSGWVVITANANTSGLLDRIAEELDAVEHLLQGGGSPDAKGRITGVQVMGSGVQWAPAQKPPRPIRHRLADLADRVAEHDAAVLLSIDEVQGSNRDEMRRLCSDIQQITKQDNRNLALLAAGTGDFRYQVLSDKKMTFLQRCSWHQIGMLPPEDAVRGVRGPIEAAGGSVETDALDVVIEAAPLLPFHMQVIGSSAWRISGAPERPVDRWAVSQAVSLAGPEMRRRVYEPVWHDLTGPGRLVLNALTAQGGSSPMTELARRTECSQRAFADAIRRLQAGGHLTVDDDDLVRSTGMIPSEEIQRMARRSKTADKANSGGGQDRRPGRRAASERCGKPMSRVPGHCVLADGHAGGCRSRL